MQLSVALNIVCIATFRRSQFGQILEETVLCTTNEIQTKLKTYTAKIKTGIVSLDELKDTSGISIQSKINQTKGFYVSLDRNILLEEPKLKSNIENKCTPRLMGGLCSYCLMYGLISLFLIAFMDDIPLLKVVYNYYAIFSVIPILLFVSIKIWIDRFLFSKIEGCKDDTQKIVHKKNRKNKIDFLRVRNLFLSSIGLLIVSLVAIFINELFVRRGIIWIGITDNDRLICKFISSIIPYTSFVIYIVVIYLFQKRRKKYITEFCNPIERTLEQCTKEKEEYDIYCKLIGSVDIIIR